MNIFTKFFNKTKPEQVRYPRPLVSFSGGTYITEDSCMEASAFYRGVVYVSTQVSKLPWEVKNSKNKTIENDVYYLLNVSPNEETTAYHFKLFMIQCAIITGNGYAEIERYIDGRPKALWPLNPRRVSPERTEEGKLVYRVMGGDSSGKDVYLRPKDILIFRNLHTIDSLQGLGVISYAKETLGISIGADRFANNLFTNGGLPSGVITHPGKLNDEAYKRLKESWASSEGRRKTGGTAILEEGVTYSPVSHSPDVLQFLESRKFSVHEIARFLGVPPTKLFDSESAKYNNIEHANLEVATDTLDAWAKNLESEVDMKLLNGQRGGLRTQLDLFAVFRADSETRAKYFQIRMQIGSMTPNQIRLAEGEEPYDGGDNYYIATNNFTPVEYVDDLVESQINRNNSSANKPDSSKGSDNKDTEEDNKDVSPVDAALIKFFESKAK